MKFDLQKAISHSLRRKILAAASQQPISQKAFAEKEGVSLAVVSYHFRQLRHHHGALELISVPQMEGPARYEYRTTKEATPVGRILAWGMPPGPDEEAEQ